MIGDALFREIMSDITSDDDARKRNGAGSMADMGYGLDTTQANAFSEVLAKQAVLESDPDVQRDLIDGIHDLTEKYDIEPATFQPTLDIPRDQLTECIVGYVHDLQEHRDLSR